MLTINTESLTKISFNASKASVCFRASGDSITFSVDACLLCGITKGSKLEFNLDAGTLLFHKDISGKGFPVRMWDDKDGRKARGFISNAALIRLLRSKLPLLKLTSYPIRKLHSEIGGQSLFEIQLHKKVKKQST